MEKLLKVIITIIICIVLSIVFFALIGGGTAHAVDLPAINLPRVTITEVPMPYFSKEDAAHAEGDLHVRIAEVRMSAGQRAVGSASIHFWLPKNICPPTTPFGQNSSIGKEPAICVQGRARGEDITEIVIASPALKCVLTDTCKWPISVLLIRGEPLLILDGWEEKK